MPNIREMPYGTDIEREILHDIRDGLDVKDFADECIWKKARMENCAILFAKKGYRKQQWIPVTERLPERGVLVLCIGARGGMFLGRSPYLFSDGTAYFDVPNARTCRYATHWMPLPEPPKGE